MEMPFEGLAAYWLSLRKLLDAKGQSVLDEEIQYTQEPFIRHVLEITFSSLDAALVRKLSNVKRDAILADYNRKIELMRLALYAMAAGENPRVTLVRMNSKFPTPPMPEKAAFDMAHGIASSIKNKDADIKTLLSVNHKLNAEQLLVKLLFHIMHSRRNSRQALEKMLKFHDYPFFISGMELVIDGFEADFLAHNLQDTRDNIIDEAKRKMEMSVEMSLGIRHKLSYDDLFRVARSYML